MRVKYEHHIEKAFHYVLPLIWNSAPLAPDRVAYQFAYTPQPSIDKLYFTYGAILNNPILKDQIMHSM